MIPFIKWVGGKTKLISHINKIIPHKFNTCEFTYIEPFVGGGAMMYYILQNYSNAKRVIINDKNLSLINCYKCVKNNLHDLIEILSDMERKYHPMSHDERKIYYYAMRDEFNVKHDLADNNVKHAALFIFLNKTCFNGLYRINKSGKFNVPIGKYKFPVICDVARLTNSSKMLQRVTILNGDYSSTFDYATENTLFYIDPPYKPISTTSNFTSYSSDKFDDNEQTRLYNFCQKINDNGYNFIMSNSDTPCGFFNNLYTNFTINKVGVKRTLNSDKNRRGDVINELLISN